MESNFECPGPSDPKTIMTGAPTFTPPVDGRLVTPSPTVSPFDPFDSKVTTKLGPGTRVGEYQILDRIGEGGMGTVYSAVHPIIGKKVAVKVLAGRLARNKNAISRFVLEARAVNDIRHPGLVDIFSFGQLTDGRHYYVMEYLAGRNLGDVLRERIMLPMAEVIPIFLEVGEALVAVHAKGIIHRDLKPENIFLLSSAQPGGQKTKLVDFGLAKLVEGVPAHLSNGGPRTAAGVNVGTPHYMSPEQCRGLKVDARADLYSLGILLYETLTGRLPFDGATALDIWQAHAETPPVPPRDLCPDAISPAMNAIILQLLAKKADQRLQNAAEFCVALRGLREVGHRKAGAGPVGPPAVPPTMRQLARALSSPSMAAGLVDLDTAARGPLPDQSGREPSSNPQLREDLVNTRREIPVFAMPEVAFGDEDRRRQQEERRIEIEELRSSLGLHIDEPASDSQEEEQMSALAIDLAPLGKREGEASERHKSGRIPVAPSPALKVRHGMRPVEERNPHLAPLSLPTGRSGERGQVTDSQLVARPGRVWRVVLVVVLLVAATVAAAMLFR
jgi:serine/threonine protein kinase